MEPPVLQELPVEVRNTLRSGVIVPNVAQCIVELVLNSLDAGASSIAIRVNLVYHKVQVVDNGCGIDMKSLDLVGLRYMTSKCTSLEDLRKYLGLFGFRGEAIASLRNASKVLTIESRPHGCEDTFYKAFKRGKSLPAVKSDSNRPSRGTTVTVHDFLYNMPVRQQRTNDAVDLEEIKSLVEAIALVHSDVSFSLRNDVNGSIIIHAQRTYDKLKTFANLFGEEISKSLVRVKHSSSKFKVKGFISREAHVQKRLQFIYVNKRVVKKSKLHAAVNTKLAQSCITFAERCRPNLKRKSNGNWIAYTPPTKRDKFPVYILNIKCAAIEYDICSDPKKTLIEFLDWSSVLKCLEEAVEKFLMAESLVATKEAESVAVQIPVSSADQSAIEALKRCEGPLLEIGRCIRSRPAMRKQSNDKDQASASPCSPSQSLAEIVATNCPEVRVVDSSCSNSQGTANSNIASRPVDAPVDGSASSAASVVSEGVHVQPDAAAFTPAPRAARCPSEDPFPSTFKKVAPRKKTKQRRAKERSHSSPKTLTEDPFPINVAKIQSRRTTGDPRPKERNLTSVSSLSEDPFGKAQPHGKEIKRIKMGPLPTHRNFAKKPLKLKDSVSTRDPVNSTGSPRFKTPMKYVSRRRELLNKVALGPPKPACSRPVICRAAQHSSAPCDKLTPANSEEARVRHVFCHPLLTNVDDNPAFVRLLDAVFMDRLSIALKNCSTRLKHRGVLRIRETEITVNQRVAITNEMANKTPEEVVNSLKSPYFSVAKAKDIVFKIPSSKNTISSTFEKRRGNPQKPVHRSPYFTAPPDSTKQGKNQAPFVFRPQLALGHSQKRSLPVSEEYRLNVAPKRVAVETELDTRSKPNRRIRWAASPCHLSPQTPCVVDRVRRSQDEVDAVSRGITGRKVSALKTGHPWAYRNCPQGSYVESSDMIQVLNRNTPWRHQEEVEEQTVSYSEERVDHVQEDPVRGSVPLECDGQVSPGVEVITTEARERPAPCRDVAKTWRTLSPILEEQLEDGSEENYKKLLSIERRYHCFSSRGGPEDSVEPSPCSLDASSGFSSDRSSHCDQEQASLLSDNILFPRTEVVFVSSDDSAAQDSTGNASKITDGPSPVWPDQHIEQTLQYSKNQNEMMPTVNQSKDKSDVNMIEGDILRSSDTLDDAITLDLTVNEEDQLEIPPHRVQSDQLGLEVQIGNAASTASNSDDDCIPGTPRLPASNPSRAASTCCNPPNSGLPGQGGIDKEWVQMFDGSGRPFFVHVRSGMTSFDPPAEVSQEFTMSKRYCFLPKGMSPILEDKSEGVKAKELSQTSRENVKKAVLDAGQAQEELSSVKWKDDDDSIAGKVRQFVEKNGKYCEAAVPTAFIPGRQAVKSYNLISSYTFSKEIFSCINLLGQLDKKFIVAMVNPESDGLPNLLVFFDQHAVHERVRLEKLMTEYHLDGSDTHFKSTPVHPPITITLSAQEKRLAASFDDAMRRVGLDIDVSATGVVVKGVPTCVKLRADRDAASRRSASLQGVVETLVREVVTLLLEARGVAPRVPATLQNIINSEACRGAIKFGDVLSKADCLSLLSELCQCELPFQCAHGRPSIAPIADLRDIVKTDMVLPAPNYGNLEKYVD